MDYLGKLSGMGRIVIGDSVVGATTYDIQIYRSNRTNLKHARAHIEADPSVILKVVDADRAVLQLSDGGAVEFSIGQYEFPSSNAEIYISTPVPWF